MGVHVFNKLTTLNRFFLVLPARLLVLFIYGAHLGFFCLKKALYGILY